MMSQLRFMQTFVEDLLDLKLIRDGILTLDNEVFNPNETLELIKNIFRPQASAQSIKLDVQTVRNLRRPD